MYENLKGKKLLVIGSEETEVNIVNAAHQLGIYVIAADGKKKSSLTYAKNAADESWDIDYTCIERISDRCIECGINGVIAGYSENRVLAACKIAKQIGTPFYASEEQIKLTSNKRLFKDMCKKYGINVPKDYYIDDGLQPSALEEIRFPVIVKPTDCGGRKGITICDESSQLQDAICYAIGASQQKKVIVEEYILGMEYSVVYTVINGRISLSCFNEKYLNESLNHRSTLCDLSIITSRKLTDFEKTDRSIREFISGVGIKNGVVFFQGIFNDSDFYVFEMGYRLNGGNDCVAIEKENGINYLKMLISYSLTGDMGDDLDKDNPFMKKVYANYLLYANEGTIGKIAYTGNRNHTGIDELHISLSPGMSIKNDNTTLQRAFSFRISAENITELLDVIKEINKNVVLTDISGNANFLCPFDIRRVLWKENLK